MTWTINITGHDDLTGGEKDAYEAAVVEKARALAAELGKAEGGHVSSAQATTNTTGSVNLLA
jgi:hypothetical protein